MKKNFFVILVLFMCIVVGCNKGGEPDVTKHVYSHRGASGEETEHTIAAYDLAILYGSKYIEQDIVVSKEGTFYVSHDLNAKRLTGVDALYSDLSDEEIDKLETNDGQKILKLSDVFDRYADSVYYVIELKSDEISTEKFVEFIARYGYEDQIIIQCFDADVLREIEEKMPNVPKMYLIRNQEEFEEGLKFDYVDVLSVPKKIMSVENCSLAHQNQKMFNVYTLNTTEEILNAIEIGVDSYFTNYTAKALVLEEKYR